MSDASDAALATLIRDDNNQREANRRAELGLPAMVEPTRPVPKIPRGMCLPLQVHNCGPAPIWPGRLDAYGDVTLIQVADLPELSDRNGDCAILNLVDDEDLQVLKWGRVCLRSGPWPAGTPAFMPGSAEWEIHRSKAFSDARQISHLPDRQQAIIEARNRYGAEFGRPPAHVINAGYGLQNLSV